MGGWVGGWRHHLWAKLEMSLIAVAGEGVFCLSRPRSRGNFMVDVSKSVRGIFGYISFGSLIRNPLLLVA